MTVTRRAGPPSIIIKPTSRRCLTVAIVFRPRLAPLVLLNMGESAAPGSLCRDDPQVCLPHRRRKATGSILSGMVLHRHG